MYLNIDIIFSGIFVLLFNGINEKEKATISYTCLYDLVKAMSLLKFDFDETYMYFYQYEFR